MNAMSPERRAATAANSSRTSGRIAYTLCGDWHQAEDLVQTALAKLYVAWPRLHKAGAEEAYARQIIVRANIDESRRPWRRERPGVEHHDRPVAADHSEDDRSELVGALQQLPPMQRKVVVLNTCCTRCERAGLKEATLTAVGLPLEISFAKLGPEM